MRELVRSQDHGIEPTIFDVRPPQSLNHCTTVATVIETIPYVIWLLLWSKMPRIYFKVVLAVAMYVPFEPYLLIPQNTMDNTNMKSINSTSG